MQLENQTIINMNEETKTNMTGESKKENISTAMSETEEQDKNLENESEWGQEATEEEFDFGSVSSDSGDGEKEEDHVFLASRLKAYLAFADVVTRSGSTGLEEDIRIQCDGSKDVTFTVLSKTKAYCFTVPVLDKSVPFVIDGTLAYKTFSAAVRSAGSSVSLTKPEEVSEGGKILNMKVLRGKIPMDLRDVPEPFEGITWSDGSGESLKSDFIQEVFPRVSGSLNLSNSDNDKISEIKNGNALAVLGSFLACIRGFPENFSGSLSEDIVSSIYKLSSLEDSLKVAFNDGVVNVSGDTFNVALEAVNVPDLSYVLEIMQGHRDNASSSDRIGIKTVMKVLGLMKSVCSGKDMVRMSNRDGMLRVRSRIFGSASEMAFDICELRSSKKFDIKIELKNLYDGFNIFSGEEVVMLLVPSESEVLLESVNSSILIAAHPELSDDE